MDVFLQYDSELPDFWDYICSKKHQINSAGDMGLAIWAGAESKKDDSLIFAQKLANNWSQLHQACNAVELAWVIQGLVRLSQNQFLDFRLKGAVADNPLPLHYKFYLGGIGSLRGYKFHEFAGGDKMILANVEYKIADKVRIGLAINPIIFVDTGYVWENDETPGLKDLNTNVGIGFQLGNSFRLNLAKPIEKGRKLRLNARLKRAF